MENIQNIYLAKKSDYSFFAFHIEEHKNADNTYYMKIHEYSGYVHNNGPVTPHMIQRTDTHEDVTYEMRTVLYDKDLKGYSQISKEKFDKIAELYDNYRKVFVETGRKIKKLIKK